MNTTELKKRVAKLPDDTLCVLITEGGTVCDDLSFADETFKDILIIVVKYPYGPADKEV